MKVLSVQIGAGSEKLKNIERSRQLITEAKEKYGQFDLICLPELFYGLIGSAFKKEYAETADRFREIFSPIVIEANSYFVAGSFAEKSDNGKIYNTSIVFDRRGNEIGSYRKINLFDSLDRRESDVIHPGDSIFAFDTEFGKCGVIICYDLRFPELWLKLRELDVKIIALPAAFYSPRIDHWEVLNRAMALTTQSYVIASNQVGSKMSKSQTFCGRSMIVDPWGVVLATTHDEDGYCAADIDFSYMESIRERLPLRKG